MRRRASPFSVLRLDVYCSAIKGDANQSNAWDTVAGWQAPLRTLLFLRAVQPLEAGVLRMSARAPFGRSASNTLLEASDYLVDGVRLPSNPRRQRRSTCRVWSPSCCSQPSTRCRCHTSYACYLRGSASGGKLKGNRSPRDPCSYLSSARYLHALLASLLHDVVDATADFITPALLSGRHPRPSYQRALPTPGMNVGPLPRSRVACGRPHRDGDYVL